MSWKVMRVNTHWSPEEAEVALAFIDELRDQILTNYEQQIIAMRLEMLERDQKHDEMQQALPLGDNDDF
jgi:hypothetical protein